MIKQPGPYQLTNDDSGHWYIIPSSCEIHWDQWLGSSEWEDGDVPEYAEPVDGSPTRVVFPDYKLT